MEFSEEDAQFMKRAVWLARQGMGITSPNPPVGAVIVKHGRIIGEGWHQGTGLPHAEREAIADAFNKDNAEFLKGATIYVTLEPCSTHGCTPPCTDALIEQGISRVVFGVEDPNPCNGKCARDLLSARGIVVEHGLMEKECAELIRAFAMGVLHRRPWIVAKTAMSLDGRTTRKPGVGRWMTGSASRNRVHSLRALSDAILVGGDTLRLDNPSLTIRTPDRPVSALKKQPWRIVMTRDKNSLPMDSSCLTDEYAERTVVVENVDDYDGFLHSLVDDYGIHTLMLECGGRLMKEFLDRCLVDEWISFYAPMVTGGRNLGVGGESFLPHEAFLEDVEWERFDDDLCVRGLMKYR